MIGDIPFLLITVEFYSQEAYLDKGQLQVLGAFLGQARPDSFTRKLVYCKPQKPALPGRIHSGTLHGCPQLIKTKADISMLCPKYPVALPRSKFQSHLSPRFCVGVPP